MTAWIGVASAIVAVTAFAASAWRWHHEGLERAFEDLTSMDMGRARSALWKFRDDPHDTDYADGTCDDLVEHQFTVLWSLERTWIRRERILRELSRKVLRWHPTHFDDAIRPHVSECLRSCAIARQLAVHADDGSLKIQDGETWSRVQRLASALGLDELGNPLEEFAAAPAGWLARARGLRAQGAAGT